MNLAGFLMRVLALTALYFAFWFVARDWVFTLVEDDGDRIVLPVVAVIVQFFVGAMTVVALAILMALRPALSMTRNKGFYNQAFLTYLFATLVYGIVSAYYSHFELQIRQTLGG